MTRIESTKRGFSILGARYRLEYDDRAPFFALIQGQSLRQKIFLGSTCDTPDRLEYARRMAQATQVPILAGNACELRFSAENNLWRTKEIVIRCTDECLEYWFTVSGRGAIDCVRYFDAIEAQRLGENDRKRRSSPEDKNKRHHKLRTTARAQFHRLFNPEPNADCYQLFRPDEFSVVSVNHHPDYHHGNFYFTPGLLAFAVTDRRSTEWMSIGIAARHGDYNFNDFEYPGGAHFAFALRYFGNVEVNGAFESPHVVFHFGDSKEDALRKYVAWLSAHGYVTLKPKKVAAWWRGPLVCGWGEQCYQADFPNVLGKKDRPDERSPQHYANQGNYEEFARLLRARVPEYRALIIDDKWQQTRSVPAPDPGKWHNLRRFIDSMHRRGKRVVLWWGLLTAEDVPADECVMCGDKKVSEDITNPRYQERVRRAVRSMLSRAEGCLNADGFKIDFTAGVPRGYELKFHGKERGIEFLHKYFEIICSEAKRTKHDALIIAHAANPYFAPLIDALRLNDMYATEANLCERMLFRREMAALANPYWLIDMDNWACPTKKAWLEYMKIQPRYGVPSLYYITHIDTTREAIAARDWQSVRRIWRAYRARPR